MTRCLLFLALPLLTACWDGGPFAPDHPHHNPCHPGVIYLEPQPYPDSCPVPNRVRMEVR